MGYVKLHDQLFTSSIIEEDVIVRWIWIAMLLSCDRNGNIHGTVAALSRKANVSEDKFSAALKILMSPDQNSTSKKESGARITSPTTNQYYCVNYQHYRGMKDPVEEREKTRQRVAKHREKKRLETGRNAGNTPVTIRNDIAEAEAEAEAKAEADTHSPSTDGRAGAIPFDEFWNLYPRKDDRKKSQVTWCNLSVANQQAAIAALPNHVAYWIADGRTRKTTPMPRTWMNGERWNDEIDSLGGTRSAHADKWDAEGNPK
jgi:hypothetical protein